MLWPRYGPLMAELMVKCPRYENCMTQSGKRGEKLRGGVGGLLGFAEQISSTKVRRPHETVRRSEFWALRGRETQESPRVKWREKVL